MRRSAFAMLAMLAACARDGDGNPPIDSPEAAGGPVATVGVLSGADGACAYRWNGEAMTQEAVQARADQLLTRRLEVIGIENISEQNMPELRVEGAPDLSWRCLGAALASVQRVGYARVVLRPTGPGQHADQPAYLPLADAARAQAPPLRLVRIVSAGITWNGEAVEGPALTERAREAATGMFDDVVLAPAPEARFGAIYRALASLNDAHAGVTLTSCGGAAEGAGSAEAAATC